jgi:hypothetical protein
MNGFGMGDRGRIARRNNRAASPTTATERFFRRARRLKELSMEEKKREPSRGQQNANAIAIAVSPPSIKMSGAPCPGDEDRTITNELPLLCVELGRVLPAHDRWWISE